MLEYIRTVRFPVILLVLIASVPLAVAAPGSDNKPNIVLVVMDNFGYGEVGVYGGGVLRGAATPNIDSIAAEGFQLTNFNVEAECTPSRTSLMTGRYGIRARQRPDGPPRGIWWGITQWEITLAEMLSDTGYATGMFGKWHLGDTEGRFPTDQGFDEWYGIPNSSDRAFWRAPRGTLQSFYLPTPERPVTKTTRKEGFPCRSTPRTQEPTAAVRCGARFPS